MAGSENWDEMILVGVVARTHGNRGQVICNAETDFPESRFKVGATLFLRRADGPIEAVELNAVRFQQGRPILGIAGIRSIDDAERLAGAELRIPPSEQEELPPGSFYHHQLIGCDVVTSAGEPIGKVAAVEGSGAASRLVVRSRRGEVLIPLVDEICKVEVAAKTIVVSPLEGLLEANGEWRQ